MDLFEYQALTIARALDDVAGSLDGAKVWLYKAALPVDGSTPLATFVTNKADYTGNGSGDITWLDPSVADDGTVEVVGTVPEFRPTDDVTPNDIWGVYITNGAGDALYWCGQFDDPPLPMNGPLNSIIVTVRYRPASDSIVVTVS